MDDQLRIVFVTNNYTPYSGGVVSSINAFVDELQKNGHEVSIITLDFLGKKHNDPVYVHRIPCRIKFLYKQQSMAVPIRPYAYMLGLIDKLQPDIIHSHHPFLLGNVAARVAKKHSIPLLFTHHSLYEQWSHFVPFPQKMMQSLIKSYVKNYCKKVDGIIAPSSGIKQYLEQQKIKKPISVVPSCLQPVFSPATEFVSKRRKPNQPFHLLSVTRCSKEKNVFYLVDLIAALFRIDDRFKMTIIGYGPLWKPLQKYAYDECKLSAEQLSFIHRPVKEQIKKFYSDADLFVFSSHNDTQGLVLAEAMAGGTPVIAVDGAGQRDIIEQGKNGFIVENMDEMVQTICKLSYDAYKLECMSEHAWQTAHGYKTSHLTASLVKTYKQIVKG